MSGERTVLFLGVYSLKNKPFSSCGVEVSSFPHMDRMGKRLVKILKENFIVIKSSPWQKILSMFNKKYSTKNALVSLKVQADGTAWKSEKFNGGELWANITIKNLENGIISEIEHSIMNPSDVDIIMPQLLELLAEKAAYEIDTM